MYSVAQTTQQKQEQNLKAPRQQRRSWFAHLPCSGHTCLRKGLYLPTVLTDTCPVSAMPPCGTSDLGKGGTSGQFRVIELSLTMMWLATSASQSRLVAVWSFICLLLSPSLVSGRTGPQFPPVLLWTVSLLCFLNFQKYFYYFFENFRKCILIIFVLFSQLLPYLPLHTSCPYPLKFEFAPPHI